mgnify:CR=1 FL=1|tara:strand:- start:1127 stop:1456 length:330 start_codon:yes stop_codon:yes gene_type:complete
MSYGEQEKSILFRDTDKRHADLIVRLRRDGLTQSQFFKSIVTGYIQNDPNLILFLQKVKEKVAKPGKKKIDKTYKDMVAGNEMLDKLGISDGDVSFVFDLIERGEEDIE